jgi:hypothetical protein
MEPEERLKTAAIAMASDLKTQSNDWGCYDASRN